MRYPAASAFWRLSITSSRGTSLDTALLGAVQRKSSQRTISGTPSIYPAHVFHRLLLQTRGNVECTYTYTRGSCSSICSVYNNHFVSKRARLSGYTFFKFTRNSRGTGWPETGSRRSNGLDAGFQRVTMRIVYDLPGKPVLRTTRIEEEKINKRIEPGKDRSKNGLEKRKKEKKKRKYPSRVSGLIY